MHACNTDMDFAAAIILDDFRASIYFFPVPRRFSNPSVIICDRLMHDHNKLRDNALGINSYDSVISGILTLPEIFRCFIVQQLRSDIILLAMWNFIAQFKI